MPLKTPGAGRFARTVALLAMLCLLAGCAGGGNGGGSFAQAGNGATVAFESVDGPPPQVFDRLVNILNSESQLRNLAIVSSEPKPPTACAAISRPRSAAAAPPSPGSSMSTIAIRTARCA